MHLIKYFSSKLLVRGSSNQNSSSKFCVHCFQCISVGTKSSNYYSYLVSSHLSGGSLVREFFFYRVRVRVRVSRVSRVSRVGRVSRV